MQNPLDPDSPDYESTMAGGRELYYEGRKMFHGRFMLKRRIGAGGMGEVWQAVDNELGEDVALKFAPREVASDERSLAELRTEASIGKKLSHPGIVKVFDLHVENGEAGVSMELVQGGSLDSLLHGSERGYFEVEEVEPWIEQICEALDYAHGEVRVAHRDIKPKNILYEQTTGRAKLADFGISSRISDTYTRTTGRDTGGALAYMGPQQLCGERCREQDDIYSLGATIFELLTGTPPFFRGDLRMQIASVAPPSMTQRRADLIDEGMVRSGGGEIPESWEAAVAACLGKEREGRPGSGKQLLKLLRSKAEETKPEPEEAPAVPVRSVKKKLWLGLAACLLFGGLVPILMVDKEGKLPELVGTKAGDPKQVMIAGQKVKFRWCPATTSAEWKRQNGGNDYFMMGSPETEDGHVSDEKQHEVVLTRGYWMMETEVTQGLWKEVMDGKNPSYFKGDDKRPVETVRWEDCQKFIRKLNEGGELPKGLRAELPTEAQWEYACRAGRRTVFHYGDSLGSHQANFDGGFPYGGASEGPDKQSTVAVRSYQPNRWGLYDMHGNVWEWCADWYDKDYYKAQGAGRDPTGPAEDGRYRVLRGGCWGCLARNCRSARRYRSSPDSRSNYIGFRLVLQVDAR